MTLKETQKVLQNPNTQLLVEWLDGQFKMFGNAMILSDQFFHPTHSARDREVLTIHLSNFFTDRKFERLNADGMCITKK
jgi:hypothetical protein